MKYSLRILSLSVLAAGPAYAQSTGPITTERLTITGPGSTGDVSTMGVVPNAGAASGTLAKLIADKAPLDSPVFTGESRFEGTVRTRNGLFAYVAGNAPNDTYSMQNLYSVNLGPNTASGVGQVYISQATNQNFDVGYTGIYDFRGTHPTNILSRLGQFLQTTTPASNTVRLGAAVAEWNLTNRAADTGYQSSLSFPETYGGTVPLQQTGGLNFVPEANFNDQPGVGTNVTYGYMVSPSSNASTRLGGDFPRTYTGFGIDRNGLVPAAQSADRGGGGRGFSFWGGDTAARAPYGVGQAWGFWTHGIDLSRATFAANDPVRVKTGQEVVWENGTGTKVAGLSVTPSGQLTLTDAAGSVSNVVGGPWTTYTPTYTPNGGSGVTVGHNRTSYEISGKTLRMQGQFLIAWAGGSAPNTLTVTLPPGVVLKHGSAGVAANVSNGGGGFIAGAQGSSTITLQGGAGLWGGAGGYVTFNLTAEIN